jgi:chorismate mutase/prephenate dehydratase
MGEIDRGQFAVHNSSGGIVQETIEAVADYKFRIVEEFGIIISHFLMKKPGVTINSIDTIMKHPQVLKQCKATLERKYPNLDKHSGEGELIDHAKVAEALSEGKLGDNIAVMGPEILSSIYDLEIIEGNLQDNKENYTSFLMTARRGD